MGNVQTAGSDFKLNFNATLLHLFVSEYIFASVKEYIFRKMDMMGIGIGLVCAVHCALFPVILSSGLFASAAWMDHIYLDVAFLIASAYVAFHSLLKSYKNIHNNLIPMLIAALGILIIGFVLIQHKHDQLLLPASGGVLLAIAHFYNYRISHKRETSH